MKRKLLPVLAAATAAAVWTSGAVAADVTLRVQHFLPAGAPAHAQLLEPWAQAVEEQSGGRIDVQIFPAMQLGGKPPQLVDQVRDGFVDVVWTLPSYTPGRFPMMSVFELPFMVTTADATSRAAQEYYETHARDEFADIKPLMFHVHARGVIHADEPVESVSDLAGKTVRAPSRQVGEALEAFGASPVFMPASQLPEALSKGVIDATVLPWEVAGSLKVPELVDAHTEIEGDRGLYTSVFMLAMNKGKYESLPDDLKAVIDDNSGMNLVERAGPVWDEAEEPGRTAAMERGNTIVTLDPAEVEKMRQASSGVAERWAQDLTSRGKDGQKLLEAAQALIEKHSAGGN